MKARFHSGFTFNWRGAILVDLWKIEYGVCIGGWGFCLLCFGSEVVERTICSVIVCVLKLVFRRQECWDAVMLFRWCCSYLFQGATRNDDAHKLSQTNDVGKCLIMHMRSFIQKLILDGFMQMTFWLVMRHDHMKWSCDLKWKAL